MPPLELAFGGSAWLWRLVLEETQALMGATRLASGKMHYLYTKHKLTDSMNYTPTCKPLP